MPAPALLAAFAQVVEGCCYLAGRGIAHRDIKPGNILVDGKTFKLADFGFAIGRGQHFDQTVRVGTDNYMAPETYSSNSFGEKSDIWALGMTMLFCAIGRVPYSNPDSIGPSGPALAAFNLDPLLEQIIHRCLAWLPDHRPTAHQLSTMIKRALEEFSVRLH
jgi:serine/threonine protein kinase